MNLMKVLKYVGGSIIDRPLEIIDNQLKFYQERKNAAQAQQLKQEEAQFIQNLQIENRKRNAEIDDMIASKEVECNAKTVEIVKNYQQAMAECSVSISDSLGRMSVEVRRAAHDLVQEKKQAYQQMQYDANKKAMEQLEEIHNKFPEGSRAREIMEEAIGRQINGIVENTVGFIKMIDEDFRKMLDNIDNITKSSMDATNQYILPTFARSMTGQLQSSSNMNMVKY